ncbi:histidine phosphatase family protein [Stappia stellulata]|uniref:histidine phosphatase family protein n=1 Tax=Stappia stellulata TaxID=71235 RepID=UPI00041ED54D|nr:histidine phosphatase family protein [Stappia stellulata]
MSDLSGDTGSVAPPHLIFIRHGETDWNAEGRMQGHRDIELNDKGRAQARRNGKALKAHVETAGLALEDFHFAASPMLRTLETMRIVCEELGRGPGDFTVDERLREITFGTWEGHTIPELRAHSPELVARRKADKWGFVPPEGESYKMLAGRIEAWLATVTQPTVVVSHGGVMRVVRGRLTGVAEAEIPSLDTPQDEFFVWNGSQLDWV